MTRRPRAIAVRIMSIILLYGLLILPLEREREREHEHEHERFLQDFRRCEHTFVHMKANANAHSQPLLEELFRHVSGVFILAKSASECTGSKHSGRDRICIEGLRFDKCMHAAGSGEIAHGLLVSAAHAGAIAYAISKRLKTFIFIEADTVIRNLTQQDVKSTISLLSGQDEWNIVRFGYRPFYVEQTIGQNSLKIGGKFADFSCPPECSCLKRGHPSVCFMAEAKCDMRSADFYAMHMRAYKHVLKLLLGSNVDRIIDWTVLQHVDKQWYTIQGWTVQRDLDIPSVLQTATQLHFTKSCVRDR